MIEFLGINGVVVAIVFGLLQGLAIIVLYLSKRKTAKHRYLIMFLATLLFVQLYSFFYCFRLDAQLYLVVKY